MPWTCTYNSPTHQQHLPQIHPAEVILVLQRFPGGCTQEESQAAGDGPGTKPLSTTSGFTFPEPAQKPWQQTDATPSCTEQHARLSQPRNIRALGRFRSAGTQKTLQAAREVPSMKPFHSRMSGCDFHQRPKHAVAACPDSGSQPEYKAAPRSICRTILPTARPSVCIGAAMCQ